MRVDAYECDWCHRREIEPGDGWHEISHRALDQAVATIEHACRACWVDIAGLRGRLVRADADHAGAPEDSLTAVHGRLMRTVRRVYQEHAVAPGEEASLAADAEPPAGWEASD